MREKRFKRRYRKYRVIRRQVASLEARFQALEAKFGNLTSPAVAPQQSTNSGKCQSSHQTRVHDLRKDMQATGCISSSTVSSRSLPAV